MKEVSIVDYGIGNLLSVCRAFEYVGAEIKIAATPEMIGKAKRLVLPGVGAFGNGMKQLEDRNLLNIIMKYCDGERPFLGICLGMQMMMEKSEEFGITSGLGIIPGRVYKISNVAENGMFQKIPHVGWNSIFAVNGKEEWNGSILDGIGQGSNLYFVHSYTAGPVNDKFRLADSQYGGQRISAVIKKGNCYGTQFHPEKSGEVGLKILSNFLSI